MPMTYRLADQAIRRPSGSREERATRVDLRGHAMADAARDALRALQRARDPVVLIGPQAAVGGLVRVHTAEHPEPPAAWIHATEATALTAPEPLVRVDRQRVLAPRLIAAPVERRHHPTHAVLLGWGTRDDDPTLQAAELGLTQAGVRCSRERDPSAGPPDALRVIVAATPAAPLRSLDPDALADTIRDTVSFLEACDIATPTGHLVWVSDAAAWVGRPNHGAIAAISGAALDVWTARRQAGRTGTWLGLGPVSPTRAAARFGVAPLALAELARSLPALLCAEGAFAHLDVAWPEAVAAFPHLRSLAAALLSGPTSPEACAAEVQAEVGRLLERPHPPLRTPLAELGLDSLLGEELRGRLIARHGPLPASLVFDHPTIEAIGAYLAARG